MLRRPKLKPAAIRPPMIRAPNTMITATAYFSKSLLPALGPIAFNLDRSSGSNGLVDPYSS
ncbi:hypothetical protein [Mesorhizobium sp. LSJC280B00]|uniref:hypothetical protein n=1 Tax=Mesorhizobium sp. LSJC280B00 TaxID=1287336 RepID=UPI0003CE06C2|nr:hypothetical protein X772_17750 [Mesorhizobium sp. LSJC280B00]